MRWLFILLVLTAPALAESPAPVTAEQFNARRVELYQAIGNLRGQLAETAAAIEARERELRELEIREAGVNAGKRGK